MSHGAPHRDMSEAEISSITYRFERWRAVSSGILETAASTFLLLIAVRWLHAGATAKALIAGGGSLGLVLSPAVVSFVSTTGRPTAYAASRLAIFGALCFLVMAAFPVLPVFMIGSVLALTASTAAIPLFTQIYQENYPARSRGNLFSRTVIIRIGTAALFSELAGRALAHRMESYRILLLVFAGAYGFAAFCINHYPSRPLTETGGAHPLRALRFAREDPLFRRTLICWMLMGFANLMMLPMRVEYLAHPRYGLSLSIEEIAFLTGVLPNLARLLVSPIWGHLFDRMNFFVLRITLNLGFAIGILSFFTSNDLPGWVFGAISFGISNAGGDVAWSLWVTKFAPPEHVADYMSVHTFFTGLRGIVAPLIAFHLVTHFSMIALGWFCAALIVLASAMLIPEIRSGRAGRRAEPAVEEVSE